MVVKIANTDSAQIQEVLCHTLCQFRKNLEAEAEQPLAELRVPAFLLLTDLCAFLGLSGEQCAKVLGSEGVVQVDELMETRVRVTASGRVGVARR